MRVSETSYTTIETDLFDKLQLALEIEANALQVRNEARTTHARDVANVRLTNARVSVDSHFAALADAGIDRAEFFRYLSATKVRS